MKLMDGQIMCGMVEITQKNVIIGLKLNHFERIDMVKNYRKKNVQPMRPYVLGEDMTGISVSPQDTLEIGGMIAINPENEEDRWYVAKKFFEENYIEA